MNGRMNECNDPGGSAQCFSVWNQLFFFFFSFSGDASLLELNGVIKQRRRFYPFVAAFIFRILFLIDQLVKNPPAMPETPV